MARVPKQDDQQPQGRNPVRQEQAGRPSTAKDDRQSMQQQNGAQRPSAQPMGMAQQQPLQSAVPPELINKRPMQPDDRQRMLNTASSLVSGLGDVERAKGEGQGDPFRATGMTEERIHKAIETLNKYKQGKASVERRIIQSQEWWKLRNWQEMEREKGIKGANQAKGSTGWLWNSIIAKHADLMDSYPEPTVLPREETDKQQARMLSDIIPVVLKLNAFDDVYSDCAWRKLQEGTSCYGVFWDSTKLNGLGDISIQSINLLNLYWEPGVMNIQDSANVFLVSLEDRERMESDHPELKGKIGSDAITLNKYIYDDNIDTTGKCLVVDWYYHTYDGSRKTLQYCQFVGDKVLYCSEDDPQKASEGWYNDGMYPFVLDVLFPVQGSPCGYGYIDVAKDTQTDIDIINQALVLNTAMCSTPRYFVRKDGGVNEAEFSDMTKPFVHVSGTLGQDTLTPISVVSVQGNAINMLQQKIDELKFITGNTDVNNGGTPTGVTAASAIAALKEDSGRTSKDANRTSYRAYKHLITMVIERIRQFYDLPRQFRIIGERGQEQFVDFDNSGIVPQYQGNDFGQDMGYRLPEFDVDVQAERENAYTKAAQNELAIQLYQLGVFNPQQVDMSLMLLDMMDFKDKEQIQQKLQTMGTMQQMLVQYQQIALALAQQVDPALAEKMAMQINGMMGAPAPGAAPAGAAPVGGVSHSDALSASGTERTPGENAFTANAKARVANSTRV